jgi:hypothetical protein
MWCLLQVIGTTYRITTDSLDSTTFRMGSKGGTATLESLVECWISAAEQHEFAPARFAKRISISFVYYGTEPPTLVMSSPVGGGSPVQLKHAQPHPLDPMVCCRPYDTVLSFKLNPRPPLATGVGGAGLTTSAGGAGTP